MDDIVQCFQVKKTTNEVVMLVNVLKEVKRSKVYNIYICIINVDFFATNAEASTMIKIHPVMIEKAADAGVVDSYDLPSKISNFSFN